MASQNEFSFNPDNDIDPQETQEWQEALKGVIENEGTERAHFLIQQLVAQAREEAAAWAGPMMRCSATPGTGSAPSGRKRVSNRARSWDTRMRRRSSMTAKMKMALRF